VLAGIFPKLPEEGSLLLFRAIRRRGTLILNYLGREREAEDRGKREFSASTHEGLLITTAAQVGPAQGSSGTLKVRVNL
jgi:hypothetical protein